MILLTYKRNNIITSIFFVLFMVSNNFTYAQWEFLHGNSFVTGSRYSGIGIENSYNSPNGFRTGSATWIYNNELYLYGGSGYQVENTARVELWKYNTITNNWVLIKNGNPNNGSNPIYGNLGIEDPDVIPGYFANGSEWQIGNKKYIFNGAMWVYNMETGNWAWLGGVVGNSIAYHGSIGVFDNANTPATNSNTNCWTYNGDLYTFCKYPDYDDESSVWKFDTTLNQWACIRSEPYNTFENIDLVPLPENGSYLWHLNDQVYIYGYTGEFWKYDIINNSWQSLSIPELGATDPVYGIKEVYNENNWPGQRLGRTTWEKNGKLYLYGGDNKNYSSVENKYKNDIWEYDISIGQWRWIDGDSTVNNSGIYNNKNITEVSSKMGSRVFTINWQKDSILYFLNGNGYSFNGKSQGLDDMWNYNVTSKRWTWINGINNANGNDVSYHNYLPNPNNNPKTRIYINPTCWNIGDNMYMYYSSTDEETSNAYFVMWEYNIPNNVWQILQYNTYDLHYGTKGVFSPENNPGHFGQGGQATWQSEGKLYAYGGDVASDCIWEYDLQLRQWRRISGSVSENVHSIHGIKGTTSTKNTPGSRSNACVHNFGGNFYLFGGNEGDGIFWNDVWKYDYNVGKWTWIAGSNSPNITQDVVDVDYGSFSYNNAPGSRVVPISWIDGDRIYMYCGYGYSSYSDLTIGGDIPTGAIASMWVYDISQNQWACLYQEAINDPDWNYPNYGLLGQSGVGIHPGKRMSTAITFSENNKLFMYGGSGAYGGHMNDIWQYDIATGLWSWVGGSPTWSDDGIDIMPNMPNIDVDSLRPYSYGKIGFLWNGYMYAFSNAANGLITGNQVWRYNLCDAVNCTILPPTVHLGDDYYLCEGSTVTLNAGNIGCTYLWNNGATSQLIYVQQPGIYSVIVTNQNGQSATDDIEVILTSDIPLATGINTIQNNLSFDFSIQDVQNANSYIWYFGDGDMGFGATTSHTYSNVGEHQVKLLLYNQCGTDTVLKTVNATSLSTEDFESVDRIELFPNPSNKEVNINSIDAIIKKVEVYNTIGQKIGSIQNNANKKHIIFDLGNQSKGLIIFLIYTDSGVITKKIIKN